MNGSSRHPGNPLQARERALAGSRCRRSQGFTLVELTIALVLLALMSALMFGSLSFAGRSWDGGEAKAEQVNAMRQTSEFLRAQIGTQFPLRARKIVEFPLRFAGERNEMRYAAALPSRVAEGGVYLFRLRVVREGDKSRLVQERLIPDPNSTEELNFNGADRSILAEGIGELRISYFGREAGVADTETPTWRERWDDKQRLPLLIRIEVLPEKGGAWPPLVIEPRLAPEVGCRGWNPAQQRCSGV